MRTRPPWKACWAFAVLPLAAGRGAAEPIELAPGPQLFLDEALIESQQNLRRAIHAPARLPQPVVTAAEDKCFQPYMTVLRDPETRRFRMWYNVAVSGSQSHIGHLESEDGVRWIRPHRVLDDPAKIAFGASVIDDGPGDRDPSRRYAMGWDNNGLWTAFSPDGLRWTAASADRPVLGDIGDIVSIAWDPYRRRYLLACKVHSTPEDGYKGSTPNAAEGYRRCVGQSVSPDAVRWEPARRIIAPDGRDEGVTEFYSIGGMLARGGLIVGLLKVLRDDLPCDPGGPANGIGYTALAWTRDGERWERDREPFFDRNPEPGSWDHAMAWMDHQILVGNETLLYYGGYARGHKVERFAERQIGLARMPRDRYVSRSAGDAEGVLTTRPFVLGGARLRLNARTGDGGDIRVEFLDADGGGVPGLSGDAAGRFQGDTIDGDVQWPSGSTLKALAGEPARLRFTLRRADLFAFEFVGETIRAAGFDADPGWEGVRNRIPAADPPTVIQNFGYSRTNHAGKAVGEVGGQFWNSATPAFYGKRIKPLTLNGRLEASGRFALVRQAPYEGAWTTRSTAFIGWFNAARQGWRPPNFLGFRLDGVHSDPAGADLEVSYGTAGYAAGGDYLNVRIPPDVRIAPDGAPHAWSIVYDPGPADGEGVITFTLDGGAPTTYRVRAEHKRHGATFDRFGLFNSQVPGRAMTVYLDDLAVNGEKEDFVSDPGWEGKGNRSSFTDLVLYGTNDFGYSPTSFAGGAPGEIGGRFWRVERWERELQGHYGDRVGPLTLNDRLEASGRIGVPLFSIDSGMHIGWFNSKEQGWPPKHFVGIYLDSLSKVGRFFTPMYGTSRAALAVEPDGRKRLVSAKHGPPRPVILPDGAPHRWTLVYDPAAGSGAGAVTVTLDGESHTLALEPGHKTEGAGFDRFGMFNMQDNNGKECRVYLDDLTYTAGGGESKSKE